MRLDEAKMPNALATASTLKYSAISGSQTSALPAASSFAIEASAIDPEDSLYGLFGFLRESF
jgi:hypothetical protein